MTAQKIYELDELIKMAFDRGIEQVKTTGGPIAPFMLTETGQVVTLGQVGYDPLVLARMAIKAQFPMIKACTVVVDGRTSIEGKTSHAVMVAACQKGILGGVFMVQRYRPKGLLHGFKTIGIPQLDAKIENFIDKALKSDVEAEYKQMLRYE